jgi:hypothetical protein
VRTYLAISNADNDEIAVSLGASISSGALAGTYHRQPAGCGHPGEPRTRLGRRMQRWGSLTAQMPDRQLSPGLGTQGRPGLQLANRPGDADLYFMIEVVCTNFFDFKPRTTPVYF